MVHKELCQCLIAISGAMTALQVESMSAFGGNSFTRQLNVSRHALDDLIRSTFLGHTDEVRTITILPDGATMASSSIARIEELAG